MPVTPLLALVIDSSMDPEEAGARAARTLMAFEETLASQPAEPEGTHAADSNDALFGRLCSATPANATVLQHVRAELEVLGMEFHGSVPRDGGRSPRTYLRVLRADGTSAGHINSNRFVFMAAIEDHLPTDNRIRRGDSQPPSLTLAEPGAGELIVDICRRFVGR
jgi:hypothetical protein